MVPLGTYPISNSLSLSPHPTPTLSLLTVLGFELRASLFLDNFFFFLQNLIINTCDKRERELSKCRRRFPEYRESFQAEEEAFKPKREGRRSVSSAR
jgi:hypothetical protein